MYIHGCIYMYIYILYIWKYVCKHGFITIIYYTYACTSPYMCVYIQCKYTYMYIHVHVLCPNQVTARYFLFLFNLVGMNNGVKICPVLPYIIIVLSPTLDIFGSTILSIIKYYVLCLECHTLVLKCHWEENVSSLSSFIWRACEEHYIIVYTWFPSHSPNLPMAKKKQS